MPEGVLSSFEKRMGAVEATTTRISKELLPSASDIAINNACIRVREILIKNAQAAVNKISEFSGYAPLKERFLENIRIPEHIKYIGGHIEVFDPEIAGTLADLMEGWEAGGKSEMGTKLQRLLAWKYGFYMPEREGKGEIGRVSYTDIINKRLATWGDKAPYWYFINYGNEGKGAYPHFGGTHFIEQTRARASRILTEEMKNVGDQIPRGVKAQIEKAYREKREIVEDLKGVYPVGGVPESVVKGWETPYGAIAWLDSKTRRILYWTRAPYYRK